jgi:pyruvate/oxaloacetate carboxyltransferase
MEAITEGNAFERGLHVLERQNDPELLEAYRRYMQRLEQLVGRDNLDTYARVYQQDRRQLNQQVVGGMLSSEEQMVRDKVAADPEVHALYDQYIARAKAHGLVDPKFDDGEAPSD